MKKILIIESHNFHEEVIIPQIEFLKNSEYDTHIFINEKIKDKNIEINNSVVNYIKTSNKLVKIFSIIDIVKYIYIKKIDIVIYNSLEDRYIKILNMLVLSKIKKIAIVHNVNNFLENKMDLKHFFVLSDNVLMYCKKNFNNYSFASFYPLIFNQNKENTKLRKSNDILNICIPGKIEFTRRDYTGLINLVKEKNIENCNFILLGNIEKEDGPRVLQLIKESNVEGKFTIFKGFIPYPDYFNVIKNSDLIMPLIHPNVKNFNEYHSTKISASFNMAYTFKKPIFMYKSFKDLDEFKNFAIFYDFINFEEIINNTKIDKLNNLQCALINEIKFGFDYQKNKYIKFINTNC